jgi:hypothetical protein
MAYVSYMGLPVEGINQYDIDQFLQDPSEGEVRKLGFEDMSLTIGNITHETLNAPYILRVYVRHVSGNEWEIVRVNNYDV